MVAPAVDAVHADVSAVHFQDPRERQSRELASLIGVEENEWP